MKFISRQGFVVVLEMSVSKCADSKEDETFLNIVFFLFILLSLLLLLLYTYMIKIRLKNIEYIILLAHVLYPHAFIFARFLPIFCKGKQLLFYFEKECLSRIFQNALIRV